MAPLALRASSAVIAAAIGSVVAPSARAQLPPPAPYPSPSQSPYEQPGPPPLETGGLTPPPTTPLPAAETATLTRLERAEREDAGRGLEFVWLDAEAGYEYIALQTFQENELVDAQVVKDSGSAFALGAGAGVRLVFLTLGARFRLAQFSDWDLWSLNAELGLHVPLGDLEPAFTFGAGYASLGAFDLGGSSGVDAGEIDVDGVDVRIGAELNWYVNPLLSLGLRGSAELLVLSRDGSAVQDPASPVAALYGRDGDGVGVAINASAVVGLHF